MYQIINTSHIISKIFRINLYALFVIVLFSSMPFYLYSEESPESIVINADPILSIIDQKKDAIVLFYRDSCPLSAYTHSLFETMQELFKKQIKHFVAIQVTPNQKSYFKQYNISALPSLLFFKQGKLVWRYTSNDQLTKSALEHKIRSIYY